MSIDIWADESEPVPRPTFARFLCNGCGLFISGCIQDYGGDPRAVARKAGFVCDEDGSHWCQGCSDGPRKTPAQMEMAL